MARVAEAFVGATFGRLTVTGAPGRDEDGYHRIDVRCECGTEKRIRTSSVGASANSCGCYGSEAARKRSTTHGLTRSPEHIVWSGMKQRCYDQGHKHWAYYGGRGIAICERWRNSFENFLADMGPRPEGTSIDRIDNNGNYEPGNTRWATATEQARNRSPQLRETCSNGHERTPENVRIRPDGAQTCRPCDRDRLQVRYIEQHPNRRPRGTVKTELAPRMVTALTLAAVGLSHKQIDQEMGMSKNSAGVYLRLIRKRLGAADQADAIRIARERGLIPAAS